MEVEHEQYAEEMKDEEKMRKKRKEFEQDAEKEAENEQEQDAVEKEDAHLEEEHEQDTKVWKIARGRCGSRGVEATTISRRGGIGRMFRVEARCATDAKFALSDTKKEAKITCFEQDI